MNAREKRKQLELAIEKHAPDWDKNIIMTQAIHETGWFVHMKEWNFAGVKGKGQEFVTHEYIEGEKVKLKDSFRAYENAEEALLDYIRIIKKCWPVSYKHRRSAYNFVANLKGYATDPNYKYKFMKLWRQLSDEQINERKEVVTLSEKLRALIRAGRGIGGLLVAYGVGAASGVETVADMIVDKWILIGPVVNGIGKYIRSHWPKFGKWLPF
jgi:hypothetical protein